MTSDAPDPWAPIEVSRWNSFRASLRASFWGPIYDSLGDPIMAAVWGSRSLATSIIAPLVDSLVISLEEAIRDE